MKIKAACLATLFAIALTAAEPLWNGESSGVRIVSKLAKQEFAVRDGAVTVTAVSNDPKYSYLTFNVDVKPFSFAKQGLAFDLSFAEILPGDSFYIKALAADGKIAASFYTFNLPGKITRMVLTADKLPDGFKVLEKDLKAAPDAEIVRLQFFFGRKTPDKPMAITVGKIETAANTAP